MGWVAEDCFASRKWRQFVRTSELRPSETKVGLGPWYTYADYLRFVSGLPTHAHLQEQLIGKSDHGREQWELTITDPSVSLDRKKKVFWHAREHAYETWSSFAVEGLVEFLLSDAAAEFRRRWLVILHPMTNVDGVAEGFEYRGGYDLPNPRGTATARLTFAAVDRWRPDFAVTWHNWVAPRDRNVVFYTDGEKGKPTPRAWLRFTQLYPSLRGAGHRWKDEITPLKYNWEGRSPLSEAPENPYAFAYADGTPFFPMGDTCYGLYDDSPITPTLRADYLKTRRAQRFNFVRMSVGHSDARAAADPAFWAWRGTAQKPDLDRLNPRFFRGLDEILRQMRACGMNAELILLNYYRRPFTDPRRWTPARERLWLRYVLARYAAFDNIFLWTLANEYETHPDGRYRLEVPGDVDWVKATARFIKATDPYRHPVTVHPVISACTRGVSPRDPIDAPWRIGEFYGAGDALDVLSQHTGQSGEGVAWDEKLQCWTGDDPQLVASLRADRRYGKPVLNTESGYEYLRGDPTSKRQVHHIDKVRRSAWRIVCAGGYFAAGFHGTIGHSDAWNRIDAPNRYTFTVKDEGAAAQLGALYDFFTALPYWRMQPFAGVTGDAVALAEANGVYVVYLPHGGGTTLDLSGVGALRMRWFNPRTGVFGEPASVRGGGREKFQAPDANDWVLLLKSEAADTASHSPPPAPKDPVRRVESIHVALPAASTERFCGDRAPC